MGTFGFTITLLKVESVQQHRATQLVVTTEPQTKGPELELPLEQH